jgi:cob(I)alamin adenosyltransferase
MSQEKTPGRPQFQIYTGDGKGKTSAALGLAVRALGAGLHVDVIQFDKGPPEADHYNERNILRGLPGLFLEATGLERVRPGQAFRLGVTEADRAEARRGLDLARERLTSGPADVLVLDEILTAASRGLIHEEEAWDLAARFLADRPRELVMTGREPSQRLLDAADLVTEMTCRKHYFKAGVPARAGIDY